MSTGTLGQLLTEWESDLRQALIGEARLSDDDVHCIDQTAGATRLGFADGALDLGLVTREQIAAAVEAVRARRARRLPVPPPAPPPPNSIVTIGFGGSRPGPRHPVPFQSMVKPGPELREILDGESPRGETIRGLRTELLLSGEDGDHGGCIALVSPNPGEGRSRVCAELAIAFAQLGRSTLLVDADLRHPTQHLLFQSVSEWGLTRAIEAGDAALVQGVEGLPDLSLLVAGAGVPNPLELLSNPNFQRLMDVWRSNYDFVIIDTPAISRYADGLLIARLAGRVLALSRARLTRQDAMRDLVRRLAGTQAEVLGSVISHF